jgi:CubicO group peptidase (beta-lactamase class C family)
MKTARISLLLLIFLVFLATVTFSADKSKYKSAWETYKTPEEAGFSSTGIQTAYEYWQTLRPDAGATIIVYKGKILVAWGETSYKFLCHSVRKSFLSALYGIHVDEGDIELNKTMADLGIDDDPPLTDQEKQARVIDLIMARSGVYHTAAAEAPEMQESRPERGSHAPGTYWYYNNWDFNALGTIFRQETGKDIFQEFKNRIGRPIGMQDFQPSDGFYQYEYEYSIHPAYHFRMTARDRARFGQLFLQEGRWGDKQLIPREWVKESTKAWSDASENGAEPVGVGYGYMWYTFDKRLSSQLSFSIENHLVGFSGYTASGYRGHLIMVIPDAEIVYVMCVNTDLGVENVQVTTQQSLELLNLVLDAKEFEIIDLAVEKVSGNRKPVKPGDNLKLVAKIRNLSKAASNATTVAFYLSKDTKLGTSDILLDEADLPVVNSGKTRTIRVKTTLPGTLRVAKYYLLAVVKEDDNHDPHTENNLAAAAAKIIVQQP